MTPHRHKGFSPTSTSTSTPVPTSIPAPVPTPALRAIRVRRSPR